MTYRTIATTGQAPPRAIPCQHGPEHTGTSDLEYALFPPVPTHAARRRGVLVALLGALAALATACGSSSPGAPAAAGPSLSSAERTVSVAVQGLQRSYLLQPALGLRSGEEAALVVVLHQEGGTSQGVAAETALQELRSRGATLAYPAGENHSWDAGKCCGSSSRAKVDDVAFLDAVFADVGRQTPVDARREALVGYSSGGMLTYRYVCGRPGQLAVAVVVSGSLESDCQDGISVPDVLALHGKKDGTIGLSEPIFIKELGLAPRSVLSTLGIFTRSAGCSAPSTSTGPGVEVKRWLKCRGGSVEANLVDDRGHGWSKLDATRRTSEFLLSHLLAG